MVMQYTDELRIMGGFVPYDVFIAMAVQGISWGQTAAGVAGG